MATVINNPAPTTERIERIESSGDRGGAGFLIGLIALVLLAILLFAYGIPALRNASRSGGTNINVPDKVDVNVNRTPSTGQ